MEAFFFADDAASVNVDVLNHDILFGVINVTRDASSNAVGARHYNQSRLNPFQFSYDTKCI